MDWRTYLNILVRRWYVILLIVAIDAAGSGYLFSRAHKQLAYQACLTLYVADVSAPSLISAPSATLDTAGQLLAGETAANFFADDILDVAQSQHVAMYVSSRLKNLALTGTSVSDINGSISGSRRDRTVVLCANNRGARTAQLIDTEVGRAMVSARERFIGRSMAQRTFVSLISDPAVARVPSGRDLLNLALRLLFGMLVALGVALLWDAADPTIRNREDVERALGAPLLGRVD